MSSAVTGVCPFAFPVISPVAHMSYPPVASFPLEGILVLSLSSFPLEGGITHGEEDRQSLLSISIALRLAQFDSLTGRRSKLWTLDPYSLLWPVTTKSMTLGDRPEKTAPLLVLFAVDEQLSFLSWLSGVSLGGGYCHGCATRAGV